MEMHSRVPTIKNNDLYGRNIILCFKASILSIILLHGDTMSYILAYITHSKKKVLYPIQKKREVQLPALKGIPVDIQGSRKKKWHAKHNPFFMQRTRLAMKTWLQQLSVSSDAHPCQWTRGVTVNPHGRGAFSKVCTLKEKALKTERRGEGLQRESAGGSDNENLLRV